MQVNELEYNTQMKSMPLPEYGRNIQRMVDYALTLENREERTRCAQSIVRTMGNMFPHLRDVADFKHKLWDHLAIMSDFKLDIDYPCEIVPPENLLTKPENVPYENGVIRVRHYGKTVEELIAKAVVMEEGAEKKRLIQLIANHMKKSFLLMNHEIADDKKIRDDLASLSQGKIDLPEEALGLMEIREAQPSSKKNAKRRK